MKERERGEGRKKEAEKLLSEQLRTVPASAGEGGLSKQPLGCHMGVTHAGGDELLSEDSTVSALYSRRPGVRSSLESSHLMEYSKYMCGVRVGGRHMEKCSLG